MAKIGLKSLFYGKLVNDTEQGYDYESVKKMVAPIESNFAPEVAEAELYAGDQLAEYVAEFAKGTLTLGVADDDDAIFAELLGNTAKEIKVGEKSVTDYVQKCVDIGPFVGVAQIIPKLVNGKRVWKAEFFCKVRFKPYTKSAKTKGNTLEFTTPSVEGAVFTTAREEYEHHATLDTEADAVEYITQLFKIAADPANVSTDGEGETSVTEGQNTTE